MVSEPLSTTPAPWLFESTTEWSVAEPPLSTPSPRPPTELGEPGAVRVISPRSIDTAALDMLTPLDVAPSTTSSVADSIAESSPATP